MNKSRQETAPLVEQLSRYLEQGYQPFHMPGHKGGSGVLEAWSQMLGQGAFSFDLTEVEGLDDLHHPTGPIRRAQELAADLMGAQAAFFLVNGVTVGLHAVIMSLCRPGDKIILPRHAHRSVYEAVILAGAEPVYLKPDVHRRWGIPIGVDRCEVEKVLKKHGDAKCLVMVHPTYHGLTSDLAAIGILARELGIPMVTDEAHGAHFQFSARFPLPALQCGSIATVQGWHKTMGSLTQSGMLLVQDKIMGIEDYLALLQSTSPSYLLMGSLDAARRQWVEKGSAMAEKILDLSWAFRNKITQMEGIFCLDRETINSPVLAGFDPTKLVLNAQNIGLNGFELARELREKYRIQPEMASLEGILLMVTIGDTEKRLDHLFSVLQDLVSRFSPLKRKKPLIWDYSWEAEMELLPGKAMRAGKKAVKLEQAEGCVSGEFICPYPPGIPLVVPGEIISREVLEMVRLIKRWGGHIQGPADLSGETLSVISDQGH